MRLSRGLWRTFTGIVPGSSSRILLICHHHRMDDFEMDKIGAGFFSEVFKVTHKVGFTNLL